MAPVEGAGATGATALADRAGKTPPLAAGALMAARSSTLLPAAGSRLAALLVK